MRRRAEFHDGQIAVSGVILFRYSFNRCRNSVRFRYELHLDRSKFLPQLCILILQTLVLSPEAHDLFIPRLVVGLR